MELQVAAESEGAPTPEETKEAKEGKREKALESRKEALQKLSPEEQKATQWQALMDMDIALLPIEERARYLSMMAKSMGLNPALKPFEVIPDKKGRLIVYANSGCADQLADLRKLSSHIVYSGPWCVLYEEAGVLKADRDRVINPSVFIVVKRIEETFPDGKVRVTYEQGANWIDPSAQGDGLSNLFLKTNTKADRRAYLGHTGIGLPDASELEYIPSISEAREQRKQDPTPRLVSPSAPRALQEAPTGTSATRTVSEPTPATIAAPAAPQSPQQPQRAQTLPPPRRPIPPPKVG